jgi:UDP-N-acetylmuramoylalanine--D-glutamate ligase
VFRPTGFADLSAKRVGIFGYGVEGRASAARLASQCELIIVDDAKGVIEDALVTNEGGLEALLTCDVVLKSPGIPRRRSDVVELEKSGVFVTSALNLWLHETDLSRVVAITGTKGKSTTTALVTFFLSCVGEESQRLGNIGQPPYDPTISTSTGWLIVEVSSFQCVDLDVAPETVVVTSLGSDHLDWHGSLEQYQSDKLSLTRAQGKHRTLVADNEAFHRVQNQLGGDVHFIPADTTGLATALGLLGTHNNANVALALTVVASLAELSINEVRAKVFERASTFEPLPGRLTLVHVEHSERGTIRYVDDGLATAALPTMAALEVFSDQAVALIAGGFDRGVDYEELVSSLSKRTQPTTLIAMGEAGTRLGDLIRNRDSRVAQFPASTMLDAVALARESLKTGGVVLLSPAAPSFDHYRNWEERSDDFRSAVFAVEPRTAP